MYWWRGTTPEEHNERFRKALAIAESEGLKLYAEKYVFAQKEFDFL